MLLEMKVIGLTLDPVTSTPIVILKDSTGKQALPIWIGLTEASAIAMELEKVQLSRPMTHDLIKNILGTLHVRVVKIVVNDLRDNTFYATIYLDLGGGAEQIVDSRPSDAIALALRTSSPIFVDQTVIDKSKKLDQPSKSHEGETDEEKKKRWEELLEKLTPEDFGKYKM